MRRALAVCTVLIGISVIHTDAQADGVGLTVSRGHSTGVAAEARTYDVPVHSETSSSSGSAANPISYSDDSVPVTTSGATVTPQESFDPLSAPAPCTRRRVGGSVAWDYCNPAPAEPDNGRGRGGGNAAPPPPSPEELAAVAVDRAIALAPSPELEIAPGRKGLTGLDSYFWLADPPEPITATASVTGLTVVAEARPVEFVWDFGDGNDLVTHEPGRPWSDSRPGSISHLYETEGDYQVGVEVIWEARWAVAGGAWTSLGFFSNSDSEPYSVQEMIAMLVQPRR